jgi:hypothetical protein
MMTIIPVRHGTRRLRSQMARMLVSGPGPVLLLLHFEGGCERIRCGVRDGWGDNGGEGEDDGTGGTVP